VGIEKPIALRLVVLSRYNKKMTSSEEVVSRYTRNQRDSSVSVGGPVTNTAVAVKYESAADPITSLNRELAHGREARAPISVHEQLWGGIEIDLSNISADLEKLEKRQQVLLEQEKHNPEKARAAKNKHLEISKLLQKIQAQAAKNASLLNASVIR
jgi:hypothetical protein